MDATTHETPDVRDVAVALQTAGLERVPLDILERAAIANALEKCERNRTHAAVSLGISVRTLQRKIKAGFVDGDAVDGTCDVNGDGEVKSDSPATLVRNGASHVSEDRASH